MSGPAAPWILLPLDGRPVCYEQVLDLAAVAKLPVLLPPRELLGQLKQPADHDALLNWWRTQLNAHPNSPIIVSLDMMAYGGLIPSRINPEPFEALEARVRLFMSALKPTHRPRYGFSSILRIPAYNNAEEEPDYWTDFGSLLYQFSVETHQKGSMPDHMFNKIPKYALEDFMLRRQKNFNLNKVYLKLMQEQKLHFLAYCQDDTGPQGLNVKEAIALAETVRRQNLQNKVIIQTGADELALTLLCRSLWHGQASPFKVYPWFFPEHGKKALAKFDGIPVGNVVQRHLQTSGGHHCLAPKDADLVFMINAPEDLMGDHMANASFPRSPEQAAPLIEALGQWIPQKNVSLADVVFANGSDNRLIAACLEAKLPLNRLAGYAAWNTPGNSIGTALAMGGVACWGKREGTFQPEALEKLLATRFLDDWYYQSIVRRELRQHLGELPSSADLDSKMQPGVQQLAGSFSRLTQHPPRFTLPCNRLFEIAVHQPA